MERKEAMLKTGCSRILWILMVVLLCAAPVVLAVDIDSDVPGGFLDVYGPVNLLPGANVEHAVSVYPNGILNIYAGTVGFLGITLYEPTPEFPGNNPVVTVHGTSFEDSSGPISTTQWTPVGGSDTLTGTYENGDLISLLFASDIAINLVDTASDPDPTELILQLIITVEDLNLHQGIDNSLDAKLDAACNALDDVNQNNDVAAINTLQAFINAVEAQRDNKISSEEADILIGDAQEIIDLLSV
ncbi:MAG: FIMAH domain-containing protein [Planctomycetota bacterium]